MNKEEIKNILLKARRDVRLLDERFVQGSVYLNKCLKSFSILTNNVDIFFAKTNLSKNSVVTNESGVAIVWDTSYWCYFLQYIEILDIPEDNLDDAVKHLMYSFLQEKYSYFPHLSSVLQEYIDIYDYKRELAVPNEVNKVYKAAQIIALFHEIGHIIFVKDLKHQSYCYSEVYRVINLFFERLSSERNMIIDIDAMREYVKDNTDIVEELAADFFAIKEFLPVIDDGDSIYINRIRRILDVFCYLANFNSLKNEVEQQWERFLPMMISISINRPTKYVNNNNLLKNFLGFWMMAYRLFEYYSSYAKEIWQEWSSTVEYYNNFFAKWKESLFDLTYEEDIKLIIIRSRKL